jgi:hypothetical protein
VLTFSESATINGEVSTVWEVMTDVASWATWNSHYLWTEFPGPFEVGATGSTKPKGTPGKAGAPFTVTAVEPERSFSTETTMPGGRMNIVYRYAPAGTGRVCVTTQVEVHGAIVPMFRLFFLKGMRRELQETYGLLEREVQRRAAEMGTGR